MEILKALFVVLILLVAITLFTIGVRKLQQKRLALADAKKHPRKKDSCCS